MDLGEVGNEMGLSNDWIAPEIKKLCSDQKAKSEFLSMKETKNDWLHKADIYSTGLIIL